MKQRQLEMAVKKAEKDGNEEKVQELKVQLAAGVAKEDERRTAAEAEHAKNSRGTFIDNFTEVFGAPPAAWRKRVEAILEWFNPAPAVKKHDCNNCNGNECTN